MNYNAEKVTTGDVSEACKTNVHGAPDRETLLFPGDASEQQQYLLRVIQSFLCGIQMLIIKCYLTLKSGMIVL